MQFIDLAAQQERIRSKIEDRIHEVLNHGKYVMGPEILTFEESLARFVGVNYCIGCASGTDALLMALMEADVGPGDAVFTTPFTFIATAEVIFLLGATPVFVDIDPQTFNLDAKHLSLAIQAYSAQDASMYPLPAHEGPPLTQKAVIPVDLFGLPCDYDVINDIARARKMLVIEDAAQGLGGLYKGRQAGSLGHVGCTSFFPAKPLGCYGDGGAVFTNDQETAEILKSIRGHGQGGNRYDHVRLGLNARLDTLQAAILLSKLEIFQEEIHLRQYVAEAYTQRLSQSGTLATPFIPEGYGSVWAQYSVLAETSDLRSRIQEALKDAGIPTAIYYPKPLHLQPAFSNLGYHVGDFPVSEDASARIFSLPMHPYLKEKDIDRICSIILNGI
ncbi:putative pleiotropic regulatory protein DegT [delta proteobacterium NaphS2]|nr:putative pleiotropic regulatory protein DegT [delta proteobacterium NaphS2]